jgi:hypothetical protein
MSARIFPTRLQPADLEIDTKTDRNAEIVLSRAILVGLRHNQTGVSLERLRRIETSADAWEKVYTKREGNDLSRYFGTWYGNLWI